MNASRVWMIQFSRQLPNQLLDHKSVAMRFSAGIVSFCKCKPDRAQRSEMDWTKCPNTYRSNVTFCPQSSWTGSPRCPGRTCRLRESRCVIVYIYGAGHTCTLLTERVSECRLTSGYKANQETVVKLLNEALAAEIVCVLRYKRHHFMASGLSAQSVALEFLVK
jgi:hypothetical protein